MNEIERLAAGDKEQTDRLRHELRSKLRFIVRRTLRTRCADSALARRILLEADRYKKRDVEVTADHLVQCVSRSLCGMVVDRQRRCGRDSQVGWETVRD